MAEVAMWRSAGLLVALLHLATGYITFRQAIPNGQNVPIPCRPNEIWRGVGHKLVGGTGSRNDFGLDFKAHGLVWTKDLCMKDSDLDGRTNGQELGDPNCTWTKGMPDPKGSVISHPGVCEPWSDPKCLGRKEAWVLDVCQPTDFKCDAISAPDVKNLTLRLKRTRVPPKETTYICQIFSIPNDTDYHIIASKPIVSNKNVMHHTVIFGCTEDVPDTPEPYMCDMSAHKHCTQMITIWGPGIAGDCKHDNLGFRMGAHGYKKLAIQLHWNNPELNNNYYDDSGMILYYTPRLRANDAGILTIGQEDLVIPPGQSSVVAEATCPADCTRELLDDNIYVTAVLNHMHYLGKHQFLEHYRNGKKIRDIAVNKNYNYDNPQAHKFEIPIKIQPGDELKTRCEYSSIGNPYTVEFGQATSDEMCYSFITFYPLKNSKFNFSACTSNGPIAYCLTEVLDEYQGCAWNNFPNFNDPVVGKKFELLYQNCPVFQECTQNCYDAIRSVKQMKCFQGDVWDYLRRFFFYTRGGMEFMLRLQACECGLPMSPSASYPQNTESRCEWSGLLTNSSSRSFLSLYANVREMCIASGPCLKECLDAVKAARRNPCFHGGEWEYGRNYLLQSGNDAALEFILQFDSCICEFPTNVNVTYPQVSSASSLTTFRPILAIVLASFLPLLKLQTNRFRL